MPVLQIPECRSTLIEWGDSLFDFFLWRWRWTPMLDPTVGCGWALSSSSSPSFSPRVLPSSLPLLQLCWMRATRAESPLMSWISNLLSKSTPWFPNSGSGIVKQFWLGGGLHLKMFWKLEHPRKDEEKKKQTSNITLLNLKASVRCANYLVHTCMQVLMHCKKLLQK